MDLMRIIFRKQPFGKRIFLKIFSIVPQVGQNTTVIICISNYADPKPAKEQKCGNPKILTSRQQKVKQVTKMMKICSRKLVLVGFTV